MRTAPCILGTYPSSRALFAARMPELLTMDFSGVTFMDSSGVGLILGRGRQMSGLGGRLVVQNAPDTVRRMLDLAHIHYV